MRYFSLLFLIVILSCNGSTKGRIFIQRAWYNAALTQRDAKNNKIIVVQDSALLVLGNYPAWKGTATKHIDSGSVATEVDTVKLWYFHYNGDTLRDVNRKPIYDSVKKQIKFTRLASAPQADSLVITLSYLGPDTATH